MPARITTTNHVWIGAATLILDDAQASWASRRLSVTVAGDTEVPILETYCGNCRRPYDDVRWEPCPAAESNEHLRGGKADRTSRADDDEAPEDSGQARGA